MSILHRQSKPTSAYRHSRTSDVKSGRRSPAFRRILVLLFLISAGWAAWQGGYVGRLLTGVTHPSLLQLTRGKIVELTALEDGSGAVVVERGLVVIMAPRRLLDLTRSVLPLTRFLPPDTIRNGLVLTGAYAPQDTAGLLDGRLPFVVILDESAGDPPSLGLRLAPAEFNALVAYELQDKLRLRKRYALGHYDVSYRLMLDTLELTSPAPAKSDGPVTSRDLHFSATGKMKIRLKENLMDAAGTGFIGHLSGTIRMRFIPDPLGSRLDYHFDIQRLRVNFNNVNPLLDSWGSDQIRRGIEKSMNNPRKKRKVQALRIPAWVPLDTVIDLRLNTVEP